MRYFKYRIYHVTAFLFFFEMPQNRGITIISGMLKVEHRDGDHKEDAPHFTSFTSFFGAFHGT